MNITENLCPVCKTKNELEAIVCVNCGSMLDDPFADPGAKTKTTDMPAVSPENVRAWPFDESAVPPHGIAIYVEGEFRAAYVDSKDEFIIGRKRGTTSEAMFDLAPLGGYHLGLSRRHAVIKRAKDGYQVLDLGSVNGTWLNNERLMPHQFYPLPSGSNLRLARMRLVVRYHPW